MTRSAKIICAAAAIAAYFAAATWLKSSFDDPRPQGRIVVQLLPPYDRVGGLAFRPLLTPGASALITGLGDDPAVEDDRRSPLVLYENKTLISRGHSTFADIANTGSGHLAYWTTGELIFSSSDKTDPNRNGRFYWAVVP